MSERVKLNLLCLLLLLVLGILIFAAINTVQAVRNFQQHSTAVKAGDVSTIHPWMTIHVVSHVYHVPEDDLYRSLQISSPTPFRHATLYEIASSKRQPVDRVIHILQQAILAYRKGHPDYLTPTPHSGMKLHSPSPGRT